VTEAGDVFLDAYPVTMEQLETRLQQLKAVNPSQAMVIKGDARAQYAKVMQVLEVLKRTDITDIGLVTGRIQ
jgi:biopolymer transport protein ExbD